MNLFTESLVDPYLAVDRVSATLLAELEAEFQKTFTKIHKLTAYKDGYQKAIDDLKLLIEKMKKNELKTGTEEDWDKEIL